MSKEVKLEDPVPALLKAMDQESLDALLKRLNKTRRRHIPFAMNGFVAWKTRAGARKAVMNERSARSRGGH